jgi:LPXTG-motif cell wall-anchored protein
VNYALADFDAWKVMGGHALDDHTIYVLRMTATGLPLRTANDLKLFARAAGQAQNMNLDVRAVGAKERPEVGAWDLDIVFGVVGDLRLVPPFISTDADAMAKGIAADSQIQANFPQFKVLTSSFGTLVGPADAIDTWRAQPVLWDHALPGPSGRGGPTATFATPVDLSFFKGQSDDGRKATPWRAIDPPIAPPGPNGGKDKPPSSDDTAWYVLGGVVLLGAGLLFLKRRK